MKKILSFSVGLIFIGNFLFAQAIGDYRSRADGPWTTLATWQTWSGTAWTNTVTSYPGELAGTGIVTVETGDLVTIPATVPNAIGSLGVAIGNTSNTLTISAGATLNVTNGVLITGAIAGGASTKSIVVNGTLNAGALAMTPGAADNSLAVLQINAGGTVSISGDLTMPVDPALD